METPTSPPRLSTNLPQLDFFPQQDESCPQFATRRSSLRTNLRIIHTHIDNLASQLLRHFLSFLEVRTRPIQLRRIDLLLIARPRPKQPSVGLELIPRYDRRRGAECLGISSAAIGRPV